MATQNTNTNKVTVAAEAQGFMLTATFIVEGNRYAHKAMNFSGHARFGEGDEVFAKVSELNSRDNRFSIQVRYADIPEAVKALLLASDPEFANWQPQYSYPFPVAAEDTARVRALYESLCAIERQYEVESIKREVALVAESVKDKAQYQLTVQAGERDGHGKITLAGSDVKCYLSRHSDGRWLAVVSHRNVPDSFLKARGIKRKDLNGGDVKIFLTRESQALLLDTFAAVTADMDAEREAVASRARAEAAQFQVKGWCWDIGCDTTDSYYFIYPDEAHASLRPYIKSSNEILFSKHLKRTDLDMLRERFGVIGETEARPYSYGGYIFSIEAYEYLAKLTQEREAEVQRKARVREEAEAAERRRVTEAAQGREIVEVTVESAPHPQDLSNVILNSPAPQDGAFLVHRRVERETWEKMKAAGTHYLDAEMLEDFDMFNAEPGWRYSLAAIHVLLDAGFAVKIERDVMTTHAELDNLFKMEVK